jgi:hypothetical protein
MTALAVEALEAVRAAGGNVTLVGPERLKLFAPVPLPDHLVDRVRAAKPELVKLLSGSTSPPAAIIEYDGGAPRAWAEALARLDPNKPPGDVPPSRWLRFIGDCGRFLDAGWAARAAALGWGPLDLFGADREWPFARVDHMGLLWLINGRRLVALTADTATIEMPTGSYQTYRRRPVVTGKIMPAWRLV